MLKNEILKEVEANKAVIFEKIEELQETTITEELLNTIADYLTDIKSHYIAIYNENDKKIDKITSKLSSENKEKFTALRQQHYNKNLEELVTNSNNVKKIVEYKHRLYQKDNQIFTSPESPYLKAHFYSPHKWLFSLKLTTYGANIAMIWLQCFLLYLALHFRLLKRALDYTSEFNRRRKVK